ncbi:MAG: thioether cross-link-forming SCIFF peptide maturase [Desulfitobacteriaceae bacterium]|nr:thioether cross-link-forming SCIFF peptide maturase [Desulfitobacteriaceae bacterium]MDD4345325.1 thioether cross-link-forming SCIFF peptide maturase [Desulfitobacteriaceae bacterium]MDD4400352.1 thioether cross-link-forming SCIFF peptide maturase [Desulfitobacteriaceae bacterium]
MLNLDDYTIKKNVHTYRQGNLNIALDINSGSLHLLDNLAYNVIKAMEKLQSAGELVTLKNIHNYLFAGSGGMKNISENQISEILGEMGELQAEGILFSAEVKIAELSYPQEPLIKAICLHVAHDCNLSCEYCFAGKGLFGGQKTLMDLETGKRGIDFVLHASGNRSQCEVDFFGGEPLLNFPLIKELVNYGKLSAGLKNKTIKYTMTTNAVLLDAEVRDFLRNEDISVVLSLDGRQEVNDRMRHYPDGRGSYSDVAAEIRDFIAEFPEGSPYAVGTYYYVRGTYTHFNLDFEKDVLHLAGLGIKQISLEPVIAATGEPHALQEEDLGLIMAGYDRLGEKVLELRDKGQDFNFFHFNVALDQGPCLLKRISGCGAGHEYAAISPEGNIYPCHQFVGQESYKLGSLYSSAPYQLDLDLVRKFRSANIFAKPACRECWARFACSGGCHAANVTLGGELTEVYSLGCELQKKRLEVALYLKTKCRAQ